MKCKERMTVRPLQQADGVFLCSIFKDNAEYYEIFFDSETNLSEWDKRVAYFIGQSKIRHFIIEANSSPVGWLSFLDVNEEERELDILVISKEKLQCGYGAKALSWLIEKSKAEHMRILMLNVNQSNARAIRFYKKFGFEIYDEEIIPQCNDAVDLAQYKMKLSLI